METSFFLKGVIIGFSIAAPVGPIGVLCIRRTLEFGRLSGLFSGFGAAAADATYAIIAAFGLTFLSNLLITGEFWLKLVGGIFLLCLGIKTFFTKPTDRTHRVAHTSLVHDFFSTFFLTLSNPLTILSFLAIFSGFGLSRVEGNYWEALTLVLGVLLGSTAWWLMLSEGITLFRKKVTPHVMQLINRVAGFMLATFGIAVLFTLK